MAASSSGQPFGKFTEVDPDDIGGEVLTEFDLTIDPFFVYANNEERDIEDRTGVYKCFKDTFLLNKWFEDYRNANIVALSPDLKVTLSISSLEQLKKIKKDIESGELAKSFTGFALSLGLEVAMGVICDEHIYVRLDVSILDEKRTIRKAKAYFTKQSKPADDHTTKISNLTGSKLEKTVEEKDSVPTHSEKFSQYMEACKSSEFGPNQTQSQREHDASRDLSKLNLEKAVAQKDLEKINQHTTSSKDSESDTKETKSQSELDASKRSESDPKQTKSDLETQIILHVPYKKKNVCEVFIHLSSPRKYLGKIPLYYLDYGLWMSGMLRIPADIDCLMYRCDVTIDNGMLFHNYETLNVLRNVTNITPYIRDIFVISDTGSITCGLEQHVKHLFAMLNSGSLKEIIMQADNLITYAQKCMRQIFQTWDNKKLLQIIKKNLHATEKLQHFETYLFGYICCLLVSENKKKRTEEIQCISRDTSLAILKCLQSLSPNALPSGSLKRFEKIATYLLFVAFPQQSCYIIQMLDFCYPALSSTFILNCFNSLVHLPCDCDSKMCEQICNKIVKEETGNRFPPKLLLTFLRHLPINCTIDMVNTLLSSHSLPKKELLDFLKGQITVECKTLYKDRNVKALLDVVEACVSQSEVIVSLVSEVLTDAVMNTVKGFRKSVTVDTNVLTKLIESSILFKSQESCHHLLEIVVASENTYIHSLFVDRFCVEKMSGVNDELIYKWFDTAIEHHCGRTRYKSKSEDLPLVYKHLSRLLEIAHISNKETLSSRLKGEAYKFLCSIPLNSLIEHICGKGFLEKYDLPEIFNEHLFKRLSSNSSPKENILSTIEKSSTCNAFGVTKWTFAKLLILAMEVSGLSKATTHVDGLMMMMKNRQFWEKLINVSGWYSQEVKKNKVFVSAAKILNSVSKQLISQKLTCIDVKKLLSTEEEKHDCIVNLLHLESKHQKNEITKAWELSKDALHNAEHILDVSSHILHKLVRCADEQSLPCILDIEDAENYLDKKKNQLSNGDVCISELIDDTFLSPFNSTAFSESICEILDSKIFLAVCKDLVNEIINNPTEELGSEYPEESLAKLFGEEQPEDIKFPKQVLSILNMFEHQGKDKYEVAWKPLFTGEAKDVSEIEMIMKTPNLEKEIRFAQTVLRKTVPDWIVLSMHMFQEYYDYDKKVQIVKKILKLFHVDETLDQNFCQTMKSFAALKTRNPHGITLKQLNQAKQQLSDIDEIIDNDLFGILDELSKASSLLGFLRETVEEDLRQLIDSVEEHSEQSIQESTISALIDVKRFVNAILKNPENFNVMKVVFETLEKSASANHKKTLAQKINDCNTNVHGLISLYKCVSNRGELTKDIVQKVVNQKGSKFIIKLEENGTCELMLQYKNKGLKEIQSKADLDDLRSRVLLLVNTETKRDDKQKLKLQKDLKQFVDYLDDVMCIASWFEKLAQCGHPDYVSKKQNTSVDIGDLKTKIDDLQMICTLWTQILQENRTQYYWLNWFFPEQLFKIRDYLKDGSSYEEVAALFEYGGCDVEFLNEARQIFSTMEKDESSKIDPLHLIGQTLEVALEHVQFKPKCFPVDKEKTKMTRSKITDVVQEGQLFVAALDENSKIVIPTLLTIYKNTSDCLPMPHQILFCSVETKLEHLFLLLQRCLRSEGTEFGKQLYCIVGVEKLTNEVQFKLVDELKQMLQKHIPYLAITCQGGAHHPFLDHFDEFVHHVQPMTQNTMELCYRKLWPNVVTITSDVSGQGKTELVYDMADMQDMGVCTIHISGDVSTKDLIEKMSKLQILPHYVLHIDVGIISNPSDLDHLLFQLIILGFLVDGSSLFQLPTQNISIEIANSINNVLRNSLQTTMFFSRKHLKWENFTNFKVEQEICSPVQVVCCYLNSKEEGKVDTKDLYFNGKNVANCLSIQKCQDLLRKHFSSSSDLSFSVVKIFLSVLANQLKKLSCSLFFRSSNLLAMLGEKQINSVKSTLMRALVDFSAEFSTRSIQACRADQAANVSKTMGGDVSNESSSSMCASAAAMTKRVESMIQWAESNHLIVAFHNSDIQTLSALYRDKNLVPKHISDLFETQVKKKLPDFSSLNQNELQEILQRIARSRPGDVPQETLDKIGHDYALTPDNLLKMILIILRITSHVPVIIMGETGCGKTSLIRYLSKICDVKLEVQNIHAGIDELSIIKSVMIANETARSNLGEPVWLFLDEINTCNHLGLINTIVCHHMCQDVVLAPNLVLMAACNPYKLRNEASILTAGLTMKIKTDEQSKLVYRVHPLPETMVDYVWDYGNLSDEDERAYIQRMVGNIVSKPFTSLLVELLVVSQTFIKITLQNDSCVSLRDVSRCKRLIGWFKDTFKLKDLKLDDQRREINSMILALAHSYHSRLGTTEERCQYRQKLCEVFSKHKITEINSEKDILEVILSEQKDILNRMDLPEGTAKNIALQENVFVIMVCILNHIPIFVVGKPGCSKSLSLQLIKSNLRGKDSEDDYFKKLPQLYCVSYQGSESSTSDGIIKVFEKAKRYRKHNQEDDVLPVVILDEIGLAEVSRFNPLKVLHSLLEPDDCEVPDVAVVGISNWALDAAKMNRAIHLSRPDMDLEELFMTGISISEVSVKNKDLSSSLFSKDDLPSTDGSESVDHDLLKVIACAYQSYIAKQKISNFHGLRDYYALVKYVSKKFNELSKIEKHSTQKGNIVLRGLLRNFGGLPSELSSVVEIYREHLSSENVYTENAVDEDTTINVVSLIKENISDSSARHLLLTTCGDSALSIIESVLQDMNKDYELIMGSQFEEDLTDDYNYRILSRIILCMEQGVALILKDLDSIYGSLYDMLNQNYTIVGSKKNCRIAHGAYSNPLCHVHDQFRCIVLVEEGKLNMSDPPFLNRFEKQNVRLADILTARESQLVKEMDSWLKTITSVEGFPLISEVDFLPIFTPDMLSSLVHHIVTIDNDDLLQKDDEIFHSKTSAKCKDSLLQIFSPDGIIRMGKSDLAKEDDWTYTKLKEQYFSLPLHDGLGCYVHDMLQNNADECHKLIVFTHSNLHTDLLSCMESVLTPCQIEKLGSFKSEKQLSNRIGNFFMDTDDEWLIIQCSPNMDMTNFLLMKSIVEKHRNQFVKTELCCIKNVVIVVHLEREFEDSLSSVNFLSGWKLSFVDKLDSSTMSLTSFLQKTREDVIKEQRPLTSFISRYLFWAFTCIGYSNAQRTMDSLKEIMNQISSNEDIFKLVEELTIQFAFENSVAIDNQSWQLDVACNTLKLFNASTFHAALEQEIDNCLKPSLAALVYQIELKNAWDVLIVAADNKEVLNVWKQFAFDKNIINTADIPNPAGPQCYLCPLLVTSYKYPFVHHFFQKISSLRTLFMENLRSCRADFQIGDDDCDVYDDDDDGDHFEKIKNEMCSRFKGIIQVTADELFRCEYEGSQIEDYFTDFCRYVGALRKTHMAEEHKHQLIMMTMRPLLTSMNMTFLEAVTEMHVIYWLHEMYVMSSLNLVDACLRVTNISFESIMESCFSDENKMKKTDLSDTEKQDSEEEENNIPKYRLVTYCCKLLIPSKSMASTFCIDEWQQSVSLLLSLASEVSLEPKVLQYLRVCSDFAALIVIPYSLSNDVLLDLGDNILLKELASDQCLCYVFSMLGNLRNKLIKSEKDLQHFLTCYLSSCLSADPDSQILFWAFRELKNNILDETFSFLGPTLHQALFMEVSSGLRILNDDDFDDNDFIKTLNGFLTDLDDTQDEASVIAAIVLDILLYFFLKRVRLFDGSNVNKSAVLKEMLKCHTVFLGEDTLNVKRLVAAAFLKSVITSFASDLTDKDINLEHFSCDLQQIDSIFHSNENDETESSEKTKTLQSLLLRSLVQGDGLKGLDQVQQSVIYSLEYLHINNDLEHRIQSFEHNPCGKHNKQEKEAFESLKTNTKEMCSLFEHAIENSQNMMRMYSFAIHQQYLMQAIRSLTDTERTLSESYIKCAKECEVSQTQINLLECLCVRKDFAFPLLQISSSTDSQCLAIASVLVHLFSTITAQVPKEQRSVFSRCLENPIKLKSVYFFSCPNENSVKHPGAFISDTKHAVTFFDCSCTFVTAVNAGVEQDSSICSVCQSNFPYGYAKSKIMSVQDTLKTMKGYSCYPNEVQKNHLISVRKLSPIAFRVLNFMLHGCFAGSLALNHTTSADLNNLLKLPDEAAVTEYLTGQLQLHWKVLKTLTFFGDAQLCKFLHAVIDDQQDLILQTTSQLLTEQEREDFENVFDENIVHLVKNRFSVIQSMLINHSKSVGDNPAVQLEKTLDEVCVGSNTSEHLTRLLRITSPPSMDNMQIEFVNDKMGSSFPFLGLVFEKQTQLYMLSHLMPLVHWHLCTVRYLSHRIKRANSYKMTLETFIYKSEIDDDEDSKKALLKAYDAFTKSWNGLKNHFPILQRYNTDIVGMNRVNKESNLSETVIMEDTSPLLQVMTALHNIHNEFLNDAIIISLCLKCHSTSFLKKNSKRSVLACINLEDITEREIVSDPLCEDLLKFSQCNTKPGCGLQRDYDFYQIEMQVADTCLINKPYLKIRSSLPRVTFSGEILRMSKTMFDEIRNIIEQKSLDKELEKLVMQLKEKNQGNLQGLLNYLEMAFSLLTRNPLSRQDVDQNLTDLLQQWQSLISVQIPAVNTFCSKVHLCHIIGLFEFVEVLMADIVVDGLEEKYTKPIPEECIDQLEAVGSHASIPFLETFICALKRFAFRYLSTSSIDANEKLLPYLMDSTLWPTGIVQKVSAGTGVTNTDAGILSPLLGVEHIVCVIQFFVDTMKVMKKNLAKASGNLSVQLEKQPTKGQRKRAANLFRKK